jgi:hypothetical protein
MTRTARRRLRQRIEAFAALAGIVALTTLALFASVGAARTDDGAPRPASPASVCEGTGAAEEDPLTVAYNAGWEAGVAALGDGTVPTYPDVTGDGSNPGTVAWADGWIDGQADALGIGRSAAPQSFRA